MNSSRKPKTKTETHRYMGKNGGSEQLSGFLHLGFLWSTPHALTPYFVSNVLKSLREKPDRHRSFTSMAVVCFRRENASLPH